ncbi:LamG domain-containing protein, partial [Myxococcota bacterium]|nr:LamG domain-containing protein [Myxococcota bacterium]
AVRFSSSTEGLAGAGAGALPHDGAPRTVEAWVRAGDGRMAGRLFAYGSASHRFEVRLVAGPGFDTTSIIVYDGVNVLRSPNLAPRLTDDAWTHVAVTMTASVAGSTVVRMFVDGEAVHEEPKPSNDMSADEARAVSVGGAPESAVGLDTLELDELRVWSIARDAADVRADRARIVTDAPGLVGYWSMNVARLDAGDVVPNEAVATSSVAAPALGAAGEPELVDGTAF